MQTENEKGSGSAYSSTDFMISKGDGVEEDFDQVFSIALQASGISSDIFLESNRSYKKEGQTVLANDTPSNVNEIQETKGDWIFGDESGAEAVPFSPNFDLQSEAAVETDTLASLSAELQRGDSASKLQLIRLCRKVGFIHEKLRTRIWCCLLDIPSSCSIHAIDERDSFFSIEKSVPDSSFNDRCCEASEDHDIIHEMAIEALQRQSLVSGMSAPTVNSFSIDSFRMQKVVSALHQCLSAFRIEPTLCDPLLANVLLVLHSSRSITQDVITPVVTALQKKGIILLRFPIQDEKICTLLNFRSRLLANALEEHDHELWKKLLSLAPLKVLVPEKWWRCAFAGQMPNSSVLELWDELIIDSQPEQYGGDSHDIFSDDCLETCDPRGSLVVYFLLALILRERERLICNIDTIQGCNTSTEDRCQKLLLESLAGVTRNDMLDLCEKAKILRASTSISAVTKSIENTSVATNGNEDNGKKTKDQGVGAEKKGRFSKIFRPWFSRSDSGYNATSTDELSVSKTSQDNLETGEISRIDSRQENSQSSKPLGERLRLMFGAVNIYNFGSKQESNANHEKVTCMYQDDFDDNDNFIRVVDTDNIHVETPSDCDSENESDDYEFDSLSESQEKGDQEESILSCHENRCSLPNVLLHVKSLHRGSLIPRDLLDIIEEHDQRWWLLPAYREPKNRPALVFIVNYRVLSIGSPQICAIFSSQKQTQLDKEGLLELFKSMSLTVQHSWNVSSLQSIVLYKSREHPTRQQRRDRKKLKFLFGEDLPEYRLWMRHEDAQFCCKLLKSLKKKLSS